MPVGPIGVALLVLTGFALPLAAWHSARALGSADLPVSRTQLFAQTVMLQVALFLLAWFAAREAHISVFHPPPLPVVSWIAAALLLASMLAALRFRWSAKKPDDKRRLYGMLPHDSREMRAFVFVCISAGIGEEVVFRGVVPALLERLIGNFAVAALVAAVMFSLAHAMQGWRAVGAIFIIAIAAQALVVYSRSLIPAMVMHAAYDGIAGILVPRWYERDVATSAPHAAGEAADRSPDTARRKS